MKKDNLVFLSKYFNVPKIVSIYENDKRYAVRSNDVSEDTDSASNAGKFKTFLNIPGKEVESYIEIVKKSSSDCFVQEMIIPDFSFVALKTPNRMLISFNNGPCEALTSGLVTGVSFIKDKSGIKTFGSQEKTLSFSGTRALFFKDDKPLFSSEDFNTVESILVQISKICDKDKINIEGCFLNNTLYILQCRPLK